MKKRGGQGVAHALAHSFTKQTASRYFALLTAAKKTIARASVARVAKRGLGRRDAGDICPARPPLRNSAGRASKLPLLLLGWVRPQHCARCPSMGWLSRSVLTAVSRVGPKGSERKTGKERGRIPGKNRESEGLGPMVADLVGKK